MLNILWRNMKWRFQNSFSIVVTILQPLLWLLLYSAVAGQAMRNIGIDNYTAFILPGIIVLVTFSACSSGGFMNFVMKSRGSFYRIIIAPVTRSFIVLGQMLESVILSFIEISILFLVSLLFSVKILSGFAGILLIILLVFLTAFFMSGLTYFISLLLPNEVIYETLMNALILPIFFLSSALFPPEFLSGGLKVAILINPFTHIINALRNLILGESILMGEMLPVICLYIVMGCGSFALAIWRLKKETSH